MVVQYSHWKMLSRFSRPTGNHEYGILRLFFIARHIPYFLDLLPPPPPLFLQPRSMLRYTQNSYFSHLKQHNGTQNMQFYKFYLLFPMVFTIFFFAIYEFKFNDLVFLIMASTQRLVLALGASIRDNTVCLLFCVYCSCCRIYTDQEQIILCRRFVFIA